MEQVQPGESADSLRSMSKIEPWWPPELGEPASTGAQDGMRYAVFPDRQRLLVQADGRISTFDTGDHQVGGVLQTADGADRLSFTSQHGLQTLAELKALD